MLKKTITAFTVVLSLCSSALAGAALLNFTVNNKTPCELALSHGSSTVKFPAGTTQNVAILSQGDTFNVLNNGISSSTPTCRPGTIDVNVGFQAVTPNGSRVILIQAPNLIVLANHDGTITIPKKGSNSFALDLLEGSGR